MALKQASPQVSAQSPQSPPPPPPQNPKEPHSAIQSPPPSTTLPSSPPTPASAKESRRAAQPPALAVGERVQSSYKQLSLAANSLNSASDELGKAISVLDAALKKLNLGISAWVQLSGSGPDQFCLDWWSRNIGYTKVGDKWGIALKTAGGNLNYPDQDSQEIWLFNEAPRWMRIEAVGKIPDLLDALLKEAESTTKKIKDKTAQAYELAVAMSKVAANVQPAEGEADAHHA